MADIKITKATVLNAIIELVEKEEVSITTAQGDAEVVVDSAMISDYCKTTLGQLAKKAENAAARAEDKKAEGDALRQEVLSHITKDAQTADEITELIADEEVTKAKVVARLTQLAKIGAIEKKQEKVDGRKVMTYFLAE